MPNLLDSDNVVSRLCENKNRPALSLASVVYQAIRTAKSLGIYIFPNHFLHRTAALQVVARLHCQVFWPAVGRAPDQDCKANPISPQGVASAQRIRKKAGVLATSNCLSRFVWSSATFARAQVKPAPSARQGCRRQRGS